MVTNAVMLRQQPDRWQPDDARLAAIDASGRPGSGERLGARRAILRRRYRRSPGGQGKWVQSPHGPATVSGERRLIGFDQLATVPRPLAGSVTVPRHGKTRAVRASIRKSGDLADSGASSFPPRAILAVKGPARRTPGGGRVTGHSSARPSLALVVSLVAALRPRRADAGIRRHRPRPAGTAGAPARAIQPRPRRRGVGLHGRDVERRARSPFEPSRRRPLRSSASSPTGFQADAVPVRRRRRRDAHRSPSPSRVSAISESSWSSGRRGRRATLDAARPSTTVSSASDLRAAQVESVADALRHVPGHRRRQQRRGAARSRRSFRAAANPTTRW